MIRRVPLLSLLVLALRPVGVQAQAVRPAAAARAEAIRPQAGVREPGVLPPDPVVQAMLDARMRLLPNSGMVVGLLDAGGVRTLAAGTRNGPGTPPPDARSVFEIGSVTKTFTATLLADMAQRGEVQVVEPVQALMPDDVHVPQRDGKEMTLLGLATQYSGLPRLPTNLRPANVADPYADYTVAQLYAFLASYRLPRDPGAAYAYSNLGVGLLGLALARRAHTPYGELVRARITEPLGMNDTRITLTADERARLAPGHDARGDTVSNWSLPTLAGAGALRSTLHDMMRYLAAYLRADTTTVLGRAMLVARTPHRPTPMPATRIGLIWMVRDSGGTTLVWHNGETGGYHAFIGFDPVRRVGIVMLANSAPGADDIGMHLLDPSIPLSPPPAPSAPRTTVSLTPAQLQPYVGRYALSATAILTVTLRGDQLFIQLTGQPALPIYAESDGHFFLKVVDATLDFERGAGGGVESAVLHQNGRDVPARRLPQGG